MSKPAAKASEPSMEEILASIRRIISDESGAAAPQPSPQPAAQPAMSAPPAKAAAPVAAPPAPKPAAPAAPAARKPEPRIEEEPDVLELTDVVESAPQESFRKFETADVMFRDSEPAMHEPAPKFSPPMASLRDDQLLSQHTSAAVSSAFGALTSSMFSGDSRTVDQLVSEMLKPMLKTWLDDNLPSLVERLVRAEIERVSRGR
jgi:cell pole-organizing protein PopZ